jgi:hypothetical protein
MQTKIAYFNVLMTANPLGAPEVVERHVVNADVGVAGAAKKLLGGWMQEGDRLAFLEPAGFVLKGVSVTLIPAWIVAPDGEAIDIYGHWVVSKEA